MDTLYSWSFRIGILGFLLFAGPATIGSLEDIGLTISDELRDLLLSIFSWGAILFIVGGFILWLEAISYIRANWRQLSPFGKFIGTVGFLIANILAGYLFHLYFVTFAKNRASGKH